ncbi:hypothetical protein FEM48_Zijuj06G0096500 [Ziziphus jujuba var. spinosa]|uniref:Uncharacterized protein n=1 Tax=Ziziphus jujuba var. spinosa TaxID=714518 RepID=A0A978V8I9_ZIZJJ|nr:hypothetical protein FEM48_Zijuj06G0096500 [Ziziphus jujuba var. spinosa]
MGIKIWCNSRSQSIKLGQRFYMQSNNDKAQQGWLKIWRKIMRPDQKRKIVSSSPVAFQATYDHNDYSMNFDQGMGCTEPDNLSRSFSARFADPNSIFPKSISLLD